MGEIEKCWIQIAIETEGKIVKTKDRAKNKDHTEKNKAKNKR